MAVLYLDSYFDIPDFCFSKVITHSLLKKNKNILAANTFQVRPIPTCMQIMLIFCTRYFSKISSSRFLKKIMSIVTHNDIECLACKFTAVYRYPID